MEKRSRLSKLLFVCVGVIALAANVKAHAIGFACAVGVAPISVQYGYDSSTLKYRQFACSNGLTREVSRDDSIGSSTVGAIDNIQFVDGLTNATVQAAISALPTTGGTVVIPASGSNYVGPTSIPSNTSLICWNPYYNPTSFGGVPGTGNGCHLTFSGNLTLSGVNNVLMQGLWLDFSNAAGSGLVLTNTQWNKFYDVRIDCITNAVCLTMQSIAPGASNSTQFNNFGFILLNCNTSQCILFNGNPGGSGGWVTNNHFGTVILNGPGNIGDSAGALIEFKQQCDTNIFDYIFVNITNAAGNGFLFNGTATPAVDVDADAEKMNGVVLNVPGVWTGKSAIINASSGNEIHIAGGNYFNTQFNVTNPSVSAYKVTGGGQINAPSQGAAEVFNGMLAINSAGTSVAAGAANGSVTIASSITSGGPLYFGTDGNTAIARVGNDFRLNSNALDPNGDVLANAPLRAPLFQTSSGVAVTASLTGWGTGATIGTAAHAPTLNSTNSSRWLITSGSGSFSASPTVTFTLNTPFIVGVVPSCSLDTQHVTGAGGALNWNPTAVSGSSATFTAETNSGSSFTPAASETYTVVMRCGP